MVRRTVRALMGAGVAGVFVMALAGPAGASGIRVKVSPAKGLSNGQTVTITGKGLPKTPSGSTSTWFADECNAAVKGALNPATDTPHCDVNVAKALKVTKGGTFTAKLKVATGAVGDGSCGVAGHLTCVIGIGTAAGQGTVVKIAFKAPATT
jgi:hypothetical protein